MFCDPGRPLAPAKGGGEGDCRAAHAGLHAGLPRLTQRCCRCHAMPAQAVLADEAGRALACARDACADDGAHDDVRMMMCA